MPKFIQMRNRNGMLVPLRKRAEAVADYLEQQHWRNNPAEGENRKIYRGFLRTNPRRRGNKSKCRQRKPFPEKQLEEAIKLTKNGKNRVRME